MSRETRYTPKPVDNAETVLFETVEQAWFWFIQAQQARIEGVRLTSHVGLIPRPCQPVDILQVLDRLYRAKEISMDHLLVLRHYGRRMLPPDPRRPKEIRAWRLWNEGLCRLAPVLEKKKIIKPVPPFAAWLRDSNVISIESYKEAAE
jgi:hypothetical protein